MRAGLAGESRLSAADRASWVVAVSRLEQGLAAGPPASAVPAARRALAEAWYRLETDNYLSDVEAYCSVGSTHHCVPNETAPVAQYPHTIDNLQRVVNLYPDYPQMDVILKELVVVLSRAGRVHEAGYYARGLQLHFPQSPYTAAQDLTWPAPVSPSDPS